MSKFEIFSWAGVGALFFGLVGFVYFSLLSFTFGV